MKNRIISLLLAIMMVAGMLPTVAFAAEDTTPSEITGVAITVDGVTYTEGDVIIKPDSTITVTFLGTNLEQQNPACIIDTPSIYMPLTHATVYEDGVVSTAAYPHFFEGADRYPITYTNDNWATTHESGIFVTFDDIISDAPTEITGLTITVDGVTYTEGNVIIKPDSTLSITVLGSNLQVGSSTSVIDTPNAYLPLHALPLNENGEYIYETYASAFVGGVNYPITYTNDGWATRHDSGISVTYDDGTVTPEPDQPDDTTAQITGVTVTVDGVSYAQGDVVITPDTQFLVFTAYGTNFINLSESNTLRYTQHDTEPLTCFVIDTEVNTATLNRSANVPWFVGCDHFQVQYSNDGGDTMIDTGIYLTYREASCTHSYNYNCDTHCTQCGELTRPEATHQSSANFPCQDGVCNSGCGLAMPATSEHSYDNDSDPSCNVCGDVREVVNEPGRITGVSITVDGVTYTEGEVIIKPNSTISYTVTGTNFANLSTSNVLTYAGLNGTYIMESSGWSIDTLNGTATKDFTDIIHEFKECVNFQVQYSNDAASSRIGTGIYLTYERVVPDSAGKIVLDMNDQYGDGWNGCAIEIYKNGKLELTATIENDFSALAELDYDSTASYEFKWVTGNYANECFFVIYADGETVMECRSGEAEFENGETILTLEAKDAPEIPALQITRQPVNGEAKMGERFCVEVLAQGEGLTYRWYFKNANATRFSKSGVTDNTYDDVMTKARMDRQIYCVITDAYGNSVTTDTVTLIAVPSEELAIVTQPSSQEVTLGDMFNVVCEAKGDGLKYQWYFRKAGTEKWSRSGQRDNSYDDVMTKARHNREVYCEVTDAWGNSVQTDPIVIMALPQHELTVTAQPNDASAKLGEEFCVTVEAQGDGVKYQWYYRKAGTENWKTSGVRDNTYNDLMTSARHNREVYCVITDMWGNSVTTEIATITGTPSTQLAILQQPVDGEAKMGELFNVEVLVQGDGLKYQWYFRNKGASGWSKSGVRDNTYDDVMTKARAGREIYCVITDTWGNTVQTDVVTLNATN